jgi:hypothetical protein
VLFDSVLVGRIVLSPPAPKDRQWMWSLDHRDRSPTRGYEPTREDAMAAFAKSWRGVKIGLPPNGGRTGIPFRCRLRTVRLIFLL